MSVNKRMKLATKGKRFGAAVIDMIPTGAFPWMICKTFFRQIVNSMAVAVGYFPLLKGSGFSYYNYVTLVLFCVEIWFYTQGQSIGKAVLGLRVVNDRTGKPLGGWYMLLREFIVKPAGGAALLLGYLWMFMDPYNRGWHDKILDTYVVDERASV